MLKLSYAKCVIISMTNFLNFLEVRLNIMQKSPLSACCSQASSPLATTLRDHHLDELPQLWNILVGDMSFVGPRPERECYIREIMANNPDYEYIYLMRPGLTSWATIYNGYTDTMEKMLIRLQMDLNYLQKRSLWTDIKIIFTTANYIINGKKI